MNNEIIEMLNKVLNYELVAIHQYFIHSKILKDGGLYKLAEKIRKNSIEEMHHADVVTDRIFYLKGLPKILKIDELNFSHNFVEILKKSLELEENSVKFYRECVESFEKRNDYGSASILRDMINDEEGHIDWIEQQLRLIETIGLELYLEKNG